MVCNVSHGLYALPLGVIGRLCSMIVALHGRLNATQEAHNVDTTLIQRQDVESTLNRRWFNVVCNVDSTSRRWTNVKSTLFQRCVQRWFNVKTLNLR